MRWLKPAGGKLGLIPKPFCIGVNGTVSISFELPWTKSGAKAGIN